MFIRTLIMYFLVSERRGHHRFRLTSRKNYERKKAAKKRATQVSVQRGGTKDVQRSGTKDKQRSGTKDVQRDGTKDVKRGGTKDEEQCTGNVSTLLLSLPSSLFTDHPVPDLTVLSRRLFRMESINEGLLGVFLFSLLFIFRVDQCI